VLDSPFFSVAPSTAKDGGAAARAKLKAFEDTHANHLPKDRTAHENYSKTIALALAGTEVPGTRTAVRDRLEFFHIMCGLVFGPSMPLLPGLDNLRMALYKDTDTRNWSHNKWRCLFWNLHVGIRWFFIEGNVSRFNTTVNNFRNGLGPQESNVPMEAMGPMQITPPASVADDMSTMTDISGFTGYSGDSGGSSGSGGGSKSTGSGGAGSKRKADDASTGPPKTLIPEPVRAKTSPTNLLEFSEYFQNALQRLRGKNLPCTAKSLAPNCAARHALFGSAFMSLVGPRDNPCVNHWILGHCPDPKCPNAHQLKARPSNAVHLAIGDNLNKRITAILAASAKND